MQNQWENMLFLQNEAGAAGQEKQQILCLLENLRNPWKKYDFQHPELAARNSNPGRFAAHGEKPR